MTSRPHDVVMMDSDGAGTLRVEFEEDPDLGRSVMFLASMFDGATVTSAASLRELARTLEHAADWIGEGLTIPEAIDG